MNKMLVEGLVKSGIVLITGVSAGLAARGAGEIVYNKIDVYKDTANLSEEEFNKVISKRKKLRKTACSIAGGIAGGLVGGLGATAVCYATDKFNTACPESSSENSFTIGTNYMI